MPLQLSCHSRGKKKKKVTCFAPARDKIFNHCQQQQQSQLGIVFSSCCLLFDASVRRQSGSLVESYLLAADGKSDTFKLQLEL